MDHHFGEHIDTSCADAGQEEVHVEATRAPGAFQIHAKHPQKKHVQEDVPQAAVQEEVRDRLPDVQLEKEIERNESEFAIELVIRARAEELQERLNQEDAHASEHNIADGGSNVLTPSRANPITREGTHDRPAKLQSTVSEALESKGRLGSGYGSQTPTTQHRTIRSCQPKSRSVRQWQNWLLLSIFGMRSMQTIHRWTA